MPEILVKTFDKEEYARAFLEKGEMLFRHVSYYQKIEDGNVRGDINEGNIIENKSVYIKGGTKRLIIGDGRFIVDWEAVKKAHPDITSNDDNYQFSIFYRANVQICCLTYINGAMENIKEIIEEIKKFGNYCVVITNIKHFFEQLNKIPKVEFGLVEYSDTKGNKISIKKARYKNQSEFRIVIPKSGESSLIKIDKPKGFLCDPKMLYGFILYCVKEISL